MKKENPIEDDHHARSSFVQKLVQHTDETSFVSSIFDGKLPMRIVQFWDNLDRLPDDVGDCIETWRKTEEQGFERLLFDKQQAQDFIYQKLGPRYKQAFDKCYHPAMQSDYFRLCYIFIEGGCYIDADDEYKGTEIQHLFKDCRLKVQPLCYDTATNKMVPPQLFTKPSIEPVSWIFYFNNNPLIAGSGHPLIEHALMRATISLEKDQTKGLPEIQSTTGPGNLTKSIFDAVNEDFKVEQKLLVLCNWEDTAKSKWELSYRNDTRNWRLSNCKDYQELLDNNT